MTPEQRAAALRLVDNMNLSLETWIEQAENLLRELAAEPVQEPGVEYKRGYEEALNDCIRNGVEWARSMFADNAEHIKPAEPQGEPVAWHVCSVNSDGSLSLEFAAPWEELAHEHINDAINEHDIDGATSWVVRPVYASPQPQSTEPSQDTSPQQRTPLSDEQLKQAMSDAGVRVFQPGLWDVLLDAGRAIERAHGITVRPQRGELDED